jgi:hypothetical protein
MVVVALLASACGNKGSAGEAPAPDVVKVLGKSVLPPAGLDRVTLQMRAADAKKLVPGLYPGDGPTAGLLVVKTESPNVTAGVKVGMLDRIDTIEVRFPAKDGPAIVTAAWGPPAKGTEWTDKGTGWTATLDCDGGVCAVSYTKPNPLTADAFPAKVGPPVAIGISGAEASVATLKQTVLDSANAARLADAIYAKVADGPDGHVGQIEITDLPPDTRAMLVQRWGLPTTVTTPEGKLEMWHDPIDKWRGTLEQLTGYDTWKLTIHRYTPIGDLLGGGPGLNLFPTPPVGMGVPDFQKAYKQATVKGDEITIAFPPSDFDFQQVTATGTAKDGKVVALSFELTVPASARAAVDQAIVTKWGPGVPLPDETDGHQWKNAPVASVRELDGRFVFEFPGV